MFGTVVGVRDGVTETVGDTVTETGRVDFGVGVVFAFKALDDGINNAIISTTRVSATNLVSFNLPRLVFYLIHLTQKCLPNLEGISECQ